jgi:ubiquinone/menaquinone biosynthesis C-methylase UbiE
MDAEKNTNEWVDGFKIMYKRGWMAKIRLIYCNMAFFDNISDPNAKTLDIGCGTGVFLSHLISQGYKNARGIEPDRRLVPDRLKNHVDIGDATKLPYEDESFDCVYFFNVLHHLNSLQEYQAAVGEAERCLKKGGILIFLEPNNPWLFKLFFIISKLLAPVWKFADSYHDILISERKAFTFFFENRSYFENYPKKNGYKIIKERWIIHQWLLVSQKQ